MTRLTKGLLCALFLLPAPAFAQATDSAAAEALFQEGRALMAQGDLDAACPKLEASHRIDPATGTLIALAACHERQGRIASAWAEFTEAAGRAAREHRADRKQIAEERARALESRLSTLTIRVAPEVASIRGLVIERSKLPIARGAWNAPVPIDGGKYAIEASAPGYQAFSAMVSIGSERDRVTVDIGRQDLIAIVEATAAGPSMGPTADKQDRSGWSRTRWLGVGYAATGVVSLGMSGFVLLRALDKKRDSEDKGCSATTCANSEGLADREDALRLGNWATGFGIAGGALVATGAILFWAGRRDSSEHQTSIALGGDATGPRLAVSGRF
jgi:hypothetical protein